MEQDREKFRKYQTKLGQLVATQDAADATKAATTNPPKHQKFYFYSVINLNVLCFNFYSVIILNDLCFMVELLTVAI
jgi:hypothetical protein